MLRRALALLGDNGENWTQHSGQENEGVIRKHCAANAVVTVIGSTSYEETQQNEAYQLLRKEFGTAYVYFGNDAAKSFEEVRNCFERAIAVAESKEN